MHVLSLVSLSTKQWLNPGGEVGWADLFEQDDEEYYNSVVDNFGLSQTGEAVYYFRNMVSSVNTYLCLICSCSANSVVVMLNAAMGKRQDQFRRASGIASMALSQFNVWGMDVSSQSTVSGCVGIAFHFPDWLAIVATKDVDGHARKNL